MTTETLTQKIEGFVDIAQRRELPRELLARTFYRETLQKMSDTEVNSLCLELGNEDFLSLLTRTLSGQDPIFNCPMPISITAKEGYQFGFMTENNLYSFMEEITIRRSESRESRYPSLRHRLKELVGRYLN